MGSKPIQLYSLATPNGQKVGVALEELGIPYEAHTIDIRKGAEDMSSVLLDVCDARSLSNSQKAYPAVSCDAVFDSDGRQVGFATCWPAVRIGTRYHCVHISARDDRVGSVFALGAVSLGLSKFFEVFESPI